MVTPASRPGFTPENSGISQSIHEVVAGRAATKYLMICPRCNAQLRISYDEPECLQCGYVDYKYIPPVAKRKKKSVINAGTRYVLRYVGDFRSLSETLTHVQLKRVRNRVVFGVDCPFCKGPMDQSSLSGKRREVREERFKCEEGHRVSLTPAKNGSLGWK